MATATHGSVAVFKLADSGSVLQDVSAYLTSAGLTDVIEASESTHLGDTAKEYIAGLEDHTFSLAGDLDPTIDAQLYGIKRMIVAWEYYPLGDSGAAGTNVKYNGNCIVTKYDRQTAISGIATLAVDCQVTGAVTRSLV